MILYKYKKQHYKIKVKIKIKLFFKLLNSLKVQSKNNIHL